jgi:PAS domain S-box-containing protein
MNSDHQQSSSSPHESFDYSSVDLALTKIPSLARELTGADYAAVTVSQPDGVSRIFHDGLAKNIKWQDKELPQGHGLLGRLGPVDSPILLSDMSDHPDSYGFPDWHPKMKALVGVKVFAGNDYKANLYIANSPEHGEFTVEDKETLSQFSQFAKLALEFAELHDKERRTRIIAEATENRLQAVIDGSSAGVVIVGASNQLLLGFSKQACTILGCNLEVGKPLSEINSNVGFFDTNGRLVAKQELPIERALDSGVETIASEMLLQRPDGSTLPVLVSAASIRIHSGEIDSSVLILQDLSDILQSERMKSDFLSMVTHDLRSPLAVIKGIINGMNVDTNANREMQADLESVDEEVDHMTELVSNLLDMSRIESGTKRVDSEICHVTDILSDAVQRVSSFRYGADRVVTIKVPIKMPQMYADPGQLGRVIDNLLSNAMKYTLGNVDIICSHEIESDNIRTEIVDKGNGVPVTLNPEIFDKFFRIRSGKRGGRDGVGLGLAVCKSVVEAHGGEIGVESNSSGGSTFWFEIPREQLDR